MKRIAITGSTPSGRSIIAKALAAMTGFDMVFTPPYSHLAMKYDLNMKSAECQWPDSFVYSLGAFTERIMVERAYENLYVSDGGVFDELIWIKCRYPHLEPIYERSMIQSLENVVVEYASSQYDHIFHITAPDTSDDVTDRSLRHLYDRHKIPYTTVDGSDQEHALEEIVMNIGVKPVLPPGRSLLKVSGN